MTHGMRADARLVGDVTVVRLVGRLELEEGDGVLRDCVDRLVGEGHTKVLLDLREVTRMDSAGIGMLVSKLVTVRRRGGGIKLLSPTARSRSLLDLTGLSRVFEIFEQEDDALRSFAAAP